MARNMKVAVLAAVLSLTIGTVGISLAAPPPEPAPPKADRGKSNLGVR
jgi:hypothetical protein